MNALFFVLKKELLDALRDRKTLMAALISSVLIGPIVLVLLSTLISDMEARAEKREVIAHGIEHAPSLQNFIARQTYSIKPAPADYERLIRRAKLGDAVLVIPKDFEDKLAAGETPTVEVVSDSGNRNAEAGARRVARLLQGFNQERSGLMLTVRAVPASALKSIDVDEKDLANPQARAAQLTTMIPTFIILAVLYGALAAALDTTAGERERGSLEPLLANPVSHWALVIGKWGAVACVGVMIAVLCALSFFPAQALVQSDSMKAMFAYGAHEAALFVAVLIPFAAALSAILMAVAIRCKTYKEAQASSTFVLLAVSLMPLITTFNSSGEQPWHFWVPGLGQSVAMSRVLKGEALDLPTLAIPALVCAAVTIGCLAYIVRALKTTAVK